MAVRAVGVALLAAAFTFALSVVMPVVALLLALTGAMFLVVTTRDKAAQRASDGLVVWAVLGALAAEAAYMGLAVAARS